MGDTDDDAPVYSVERGDDGLEEWRVTGPNGLVGAYPTQSDAQAKADFLNEQIAEERENDA